MYQNSLKAFFPLDLLFVSTAPASTLVLCPGIVAVTLISIFHFSLAETFLHLTQSCMATPERNFASHAMD